MSIIASNFDSLLDVPIPKMKNDLRSTVLKVAFHSQILVEPAQL